MDSGSTKDKVIDIIVLKMGVERESVTLDTKYADDLGTDSLDRAELVMEIEDEFDINIPDEAEGKIKNVGDTIKFIEEQLKSKSH